MVEPCGIQSVTDPVLHCDNCRSEIQIWPQPDEKNMSREDYFVEMVEEMTPVPDNAAHTEDQT